MKVRNARRNAFLKGYYRDYVRFKERCGDEVRITSGPDADGVEVLMVQQNGESPIFLTRRHVLALLPHFQAWAETYSLRLPEDTKGAN